MNFTLRPAAKQDTPAIYDLIIEGRINPTGIEWQRFILAVTADGEVIGCGQLKPHRDGSLELASIAVTSAWQGKGVARAIIEQLIAGRPGQNKCVLHPIHFLKLCFVMKIMVRLLAVPARF